MKATEIVQAPLFPKLRHSGDKRKTSCGNADKICEYLMAADAVITLTELPNTIRPVKTRRAGRCECRSCACRFAAEMPACHQRSPLRAGSPRGGGWHESCVTSL